MPPSALIWAAAAFAPAVYGVSRSVPVSLSVTSSNTAGLLLLTAAAELVALALVVAELVALAALLVLLGLLALLLLLLLPHAARPTVQSTVTPSAANLARYLRISHILSLVTDNDTLLRLAPSRLGANSSPDIIVHDSIDRLARDQVPMGRRKPRLTGA
jgi:hypothetical protein